MWLFAFCFSFQGKLYELVRNFGLAPSSTRIVWKTIENLIRLNCELSQCRPPPFREVIVPTHHLQQEVVTTSDSRIVELYEIAQHILLGIVLSAILEGGGNVKDYTVRSQFPVLKRAKFKGDLALVIASPGTRTRHGKLVSCLGKQTHTLLCFWVLLLCSAGRVFATIQTFHNLRNILSRLITLQMHILWICTHNTCTNSTLHTLSCTLTQKWCRHCLVH